jgi:hypothetical protein
MTKIEAIACLDALHRAVEEADLAGLDKLDLSGMTTIIQSVAPTPEVAHAERQAMARIGFLERAIRSNGALPPTNDIEKLRRRAGRAVMALRDAVHREEPSPSAAAA